jgi:hypothetical protein
MWNEFFLTAIVPCALLSWSWRAPYLALASLLLAEQEHSRTTSSERRRPRPEDAAQQVRRF